MASILAVWGALFWFIILAGRIPLYLSARTAWVAYVGAIILCAAALGSLISARFEHRERIEGRQLVGFGALLLPALLILLLPPGTLSSYAAGKRAVSLSRSYLGARGTVSEEGPLSFRDVLAAESSPEAMRDLSARAGTESSFVGFVGKSSTGHGDEFPLIRFMTTCCPGDAIPITLRVVSAPPGRFRADDWVEVTGTVYPTPADVIVIASRIVPVPRPDHPYLSP